MNKTILRRILVGAVALVLLGLLAVWAFSDVRVKSWPENARMIYARGALSDYLVARCIAPTEIRFISAGKAAKVGETDVGSFSDQAEYITVWGIRGVEKEYPVMVSVFPDSEYAVTWWYDSSEASKNDFYVSSSRWADASATERGVADPEILKMSGMPGSTRCNAERPPTE